MPEMERALAGLDEAAYETAVLAPTHAARA
jgi:hypothetical protein